MIKIFVLIFTLLALNGCTKDRDKATDLEYWQDPNTKLCFASLGNQFGNNFAFTNVPCDKITLVVIK